jgi:hypothetical protein
MAIRPARPLRQALLAAALLWPFAQAEALLFELTVTGEVTAVSAGLAGAFAVGEPMSATFLYESDTPAAIALQTQATYPGALAGGSYSVGDDSGTSSFGNVNVANDDASLADTYTFSNLGIVGTSVGTHVPFMFRITLQDTTGLALGSLDLPESLPALAAFTDRSWLLAFTPVALQGEQTGVRGTLLSAQLTPLAVPEPASIALLAAGLAVLLARASRRHAAA